jgi:NADP-dependent alcohol dehydrogenase
VVELLPATVHIVDQAWTVDDIVQVAETTTLGSVLAIGGGATIDAAKLVAVCARARALRRHLLVPHRSGVRWIPPTAPRLPLAAVPTTLGTGSEASAGACALVGGDRRVLFLGPGLRPDHHVHVPELTATLPQPLARAGAVEVLFRLLGPLVGSLSPNAGPVLRLSSKLVAILDRTPADRPFCRRDRVAVAAISAAAHSLNKLHAVDPVGHKAWYVANELSSVTDEAKVPATAAVLPTVWANIAAGDRRWGNRANLVHACALLGLDVDSPSALTRRFDAWGITPTRCAGDGIAAIVARRVVRFWGAGLPMMGDFHVDEVTELVTRSTNVVAEAGT